MVLGALLDPDLTPKRDEDVLHFLIQNYVNPNDLGGVTSMEFCRVQNVVSG